jgi:hypothetical protein
MQSGNAASLRGSSKVAGPKPEETTANLDIYRPLAKQVTVSIPTQLKRGLSSTTLTRAETPPISPTHKTPLVNNLPPLPPPFGVYPKSAEQSPKFPTWYTR